MFDELASEGMYKNLFNGAWTYWDDRQSIEIRSPIDAAVVGRVQSLSTSDIDNILANSKEAAEKWSETPVNKRAAILHKTADLLDEHQRELAEMMVREIAKDIESSVAEVKRTVDFIRFTADEGKHLEGETIGADNFPGFGRNKLSFVTRVPLGVVLAISPFNYPVNLSASKIAPALVAGNCVILKPPTQGAVSALYLAQLFNKAGLPEGVLNTITGKGSVVGDYLVTHPDIDFINFTGSTDVGRHIAKLAGMIPLMLELGGKDAAIVLEDADPEETSEKIVSGAYAYSGQRCTAVKRVLAFDNSGDVLVDHLKRKVLSLKVGNPWDGCVVTPLIDSSAADFVQELIDDALRKGAVLVTGNVRKGNLLYPTLIDKVTPEMRLAWEEPFGPVLPVIRVRSIDEAVDIANRSEYGLQSSVFTRDIDKAFYIARKLEVGTVQINNKTERGPDHFPFLGVKSSGMGTQGIRYSIEAMSRPKAIVLNLRDNISGM